MPSDRGRVCVLARLTSGRGKRSIDKDAFGDGGPFMWVYCCKLQTSRLFFGLALAAVLLTSTATVSQAQSTIAFVQQNYSDPQTPQTTVTVPYALAQTAGDLNVVIVGWNDSTATVTSVNDTSRNIYTLAVGPTIQTGVATQAIYYAKNIFGAAAGANTVTVTFASAANFPDIRM